MTPLVSVIIPFYDRADWLCDAVQSILNQTYENFEIIVINDGSREDVSDFLNKFGNRIIYRYKENGGSASARNLAMDIATGEYLAFLDSDDVWLPEKTTKQIKFMEERNAMWSHTGFKYWIPNLEKYITVDNKHDYGYIYLKYFISVRIATPSVIIRKALLEKHPDLKFPVEYRKGQDVKFYHKISTYYPLYLINEPLVKVRWRGDNTHTRALVRFTLKSRGYLEMKKDSKQYNGLPLGIKLIYKIYHFYRKLFGYYDIKGPILKEAVAKIFWILPYSIERIYIKKITLKTNTNDKMKYTL